MENSLVSIIIPVYKVEKYLHRCVHSVVNQTYQNLEIILVDDGSPDNCPRLCDEWASRDPRIRVIHKANEGLSSARNSGLDICNGEYIGFVDSDDWVSADMVEVLLQNCEKHQVKLAVCGRKVVYDKPGMPTEEKIPSRTAVMDVNAAVAQMFQGREFDCSACAKLYHRSLWEDIRFPFGKIYEDIAVLYKVVFASDGVAVIDQPLYFYFRHSESITSAVFTEAWLDYPSNTRAVLQDIEANYADLFEYACRIHMKAIECVMVRLAKAGRRQYQEYIATFRQLSGEVSMYQSAWRTSAVFAEKDIQMFRLLSHWRIVRPLVKFAQLLKKHR